MKSVSYVLTNEIELDLNGLWEEREREREQERDREREWSDEIPKSWKKESKAIEREKERKEWKRKMEWERVLRIEGSLSKMVKNWEKYERWGVWVIVEWLWSMIQWWRVVSRERDRRERWVKRERRERDM